MAGVVRPGNAGATHVSRFAAGGTSTAVDHIEVTDLALAQIPDPDRHGRPILIRADGAGATETWLTHLHQARAERGLDLDCSVGFTMTAPVRAAILALPTVAWTPAVQVDGSPREGAGVADLTGVLQAQGLDLTGNAVWLERALTAADLLAWT